jgi:hypothetical protein
VFFTSRDDATTGAPAPAVPGQPLTTATPYAADLRLGNIVLEAPAPQRAASDALARAVAGPPDPALRAAGQAVLVRAGTDAQVVAVARDRMLRVATAGDPRLRQFVEYWLGRAAG